MATGQVVKIRFEGQDLTNKAISSLNRNLNQAGKAIGNIQRSLGGMTAALGAAAGAAGFGLMARNALQTADALGKTSRKLGVTASELFKFQTQANLAGISTDTANMALQRFVRRTAEAAQGTGEAKNALIELGVNAREIQNLPLAERMKVLADAFAGVQNPADRLRLAFKLFDSEGASMVNMLEGGREPLEETERRMRELGLEIDNNSLPAIEDFNDSLELMQRQVQVAMIDGLGDSIPVMQDVADKLAALIKPMTQGLLKGLDYLLTNLDTITKGLKYFAMAIAGVKVLQFAVGLAQLAKALGLVRLAALALTTALGPIALVIGAAGAAATYFADDLKKLGKRFGILEDDTDDAADKTDGFTGSIEDLQDIVVKVEKKDLPAFAKEVDNIADEEIDATLRTNEFRVALEKLREKALKPKKDLEDYAAQVAILKKRFEDGETSSEQFRREMAELAKQYTGVKDKAQELIDEQALLEASLKELADAGLENTTVFTATEKRLKELTKELKEATDATAGMTSEQKKLYEEATRVEREISEAEQALKDYDKMLREGQISVEQYRRATADVKEELKELREEQLTPLQKAIKGVFDDTGVGRFLNKMEELNQSPVFTDLMEKLVGSGQGGVKGAIDSCFGTTPVTDFGKAISDLFDGASSPLGGLKGAFDALQDAISGGGGFFPSVLASMGSFVSDFVAKLGELAAAAIASVGLSFLKNLIPGLRDGGIVEGFASGGQVSGPGGPTADRVPAMLSNGEYVIRASSVNKFGAAFFDAVNSGVMPGFALGGSVGSASTGRGFYVSGTSIDNIDFFELFSQHFGNFGPAGNIEGIENVVRTILVTMETFQNAIKKGVTDAISAVTETVFGGTAVFETGYVTEIINKVLEGVFGGLIDVAQSGEIPMEGNIFDRIREAIFRGGTFPNVSNEFSEPFAQSMIDELIRLIRRLQNTLIDFSFDEEAKALFNRADAIAGGGLYVQGRQFGGPLERGQASMVGEDGPELFIPNRGGTVSPIKGNSVDLQQSIDDMKDEIIALRRQLSRELSGRRPAGVR